MSATLPMFALWVLAALALVARQRAYFMTSTSLLCMAGALALWLLVSRIFG
jgi:hypothetical protein